MNAQSHEWADDNCDKDTATPLPRLYLRPDEAARVIGVSRRTLASWQSTASSFPPRRSHNPFFRRGHPGGA